MPGGCVHVDAYKCSDVMKIKFMEVHVHVYDLQWRSEWH